MSTPEQPQRPPLVSDEIIIMHMHRANGDMDLCDRIRQEYEDLITSGKLRVVEEVEWDRKKPGCAKCGHAWSVLLTISVYCPGCGNPIKR